METQAIDEYCFLTIRNIRTPVKQAVRCFTQQLSPNRWNIFRHGIGPFLHSNGTCSANWHVEVKRRLFRHTKTEPVMTGGLLQPTANLF